MKQKHYESVVLGSSPAALLCAHSLQLQGMSCAILESADSIGGLFKPINMDGELFSSHLEFVSLPSTQFLASLRELLPEAEAQIFDLGPITFQNGQVQPFLGFGETSDEALSERVHLTQSQQMALNINSTDLIREFKLHFKGDILCKSAVTGLDLQPQAAVIQINHSETISANTVYVFENPHDVSAWFQKSSHAPPKNVLQKLGKSPLWTSLNLTYFHKNPLTESKAVHVLSGAKGEFCLGRFSTEKSRSLSHWMSLVSSEEGQDSETLGAHLREMKKQMKRMYPHFFDSVEKEIISVIPKAYGHTPAGLVDSHGHLAKTPRFVFSGRYYSGIPGLSGEFASLPISIEPLPSTNERSAEV